MDTFVFEDRPASCGSIKGFAVCNLNGEEVGVVWKHKHKKGELAEGQAEIRFYDHKVAKYGTWRRIFIDTARLSFDYLAYKLSKEGSLTLTIDPRKGA